MKNRGYYLKQVFSSKRFAIAAAGLLLLNCVFILISNSIDLSAWIRLESAYRQNSVAGIFTDDILSAAGASFLNVSICAELLILFDLLKKRGRSVRIVIGTLFSVAGVYMLFRWLYRLIPVAMDSEEIFLLVLFSIIIITVFAVPTLLLFLKPRMSLAGLGFAVLSAVELFSNSDVLYESILNLQMFNQTSFEFENKAVLIKNACFNITIASLGILSFFATILAAVLCFRAHSEKPIKGLRHLLASIVVLFVLSNFLSSIIGIVFRILKVQDIGSIYTETQRVLLETTSHIGAIMSLSGTIFALITFMLRKEESFPALEAEPGMSVQTDENQSI